MSDPIKIELVGLDNLQARFSAIGPALQDKLRVFFAAFTLRLRDQVKANIAERFKSTGPLYQSVQSEMIEEPGSITGRVFTAGVPYAAIQEYGGRTRPHIIQPVNASVLAFMSPASIGISKGGSNLLVFAKQVNHPGSNLPERTYARLALVQMRGQFTDGIRGVVSEAAAAAMGVAAE